METQGADPSRATSQAMPIPAAAPPSTVTARPTRSNRCAVRATAPDTTIPATPMAMYVAGSHPAPYASRNIALATTPSSAAIAPNSRACAVSHGTAAPAERGADVTSRSGRSVPPGVAAARLTIATSAAMIPFASAGRSASSSSRSGLSIRSSIVGWRAVTDAARGSGTSAASSPTVAPGPRTASVSSPRWTRSEPWTMANRWSSTAPSSMTTAPAFTSTSLARCASAASVRPGTSTNSPTRWSATTRSIVDSVMR